MWPRSKKLRLVKESVASWRRSSAGWMPERTGRFSVGRKRRHPVTMRKASLRTLSMRQYARCDTKPVHSTQQLSRSRTRQLCAMSWHQHPILNQQVAWTGRQMLSRSPVHEYAYPPNLYDRAKPYLLKPQGIYCYRCSGKAL